MDRGHEEDWEVVVDQSKPRAVVHLQVVEEHGHWNRDLLIIGDL